MFTGGLVGVAHEVVIGKIERPFLLALLGGMMGLPTVLRKDEGRQE